MSLARWNLLACLGFAVCATTSAQVVVDEHSGYELGIDYQVFPPSQITILAPSDPGVPYDFDCYDQSTGDPATIQGITALPYIGNVEVMVRGHDGRPFGATNVELLQLNPTGVSGTLAYLLIGGDLGTAGPTSITNVTGLASVGTIHHDVNIDHVCQPGTLRSTSLQGNLNIGWLEGDVFINSLVGNTNIVLWTGTYPAGYTGYFSAANVQGDINVQTCIWGYLWCGSLDGNLTVAGDDEENFPMLAAVYGNYGAGQQIRTMSFGDHVLLEMLEIERLGANGRVGCAGAGLCNITVWDCLQG